MNSSPCKPRNGAAWKWAVGVLTILALGFVSWTSAEIIGLKSFRTATETLQLPVRLDAIDEKLATIQTDVAVIRAKAEDK